MGYLQITKNSIEHYMNIRYLVEKACVLANKNKLDIDYVGPDSNLKDFPTEWLKKNFNKKFKINLIDYNKNTISKIKKFLDLNLPELENSIAVSCKDITGTYSMLNIEILNIYELFKTHNDCIKAIIESLGKVKVVNYIKQNKVIISCNVITELCLELETFIEKIHFIKYGSTIKNDINISAGLFQKYKLALKCLNRKLTINHLNLISSYKMFLIVLSPYLKTRFFREIYINKCCDDNSTIKYVELITGNTNLHPGLSWDWKVKKGVLRMNSIYSDDLFYI